MATVEEVQSALQAYIEREVNKTYITARIGQDAGNEQWQSKAAPPGYVAITFEDGLEAEARNDGRVVPLPGREVEVQLVNGRYVVRGTAPEPAQEGDAAATERGLGVGLHHHSIGQIHFVPLDEASMVDGGAEVAIGTTNVNFYRKMYIDDAGVPAVYGGGDTVDVQGTYGGTLAADEQAWVLAYIAPSTGALSFHEAAGATAPLNATTDLETALTDFNTNVSAGAPYMAIRVGKGAVPYKRYKPASRYDYDSKDIIRFDVNGFTTLSALADTSISGLANDDALMYNNGTSVFENRPLTAGDIKSGTLLHERGGLEADVSAYGGIPLISGGATSEIKYNLTATTDPGATDDSGSGYAVGSVWVRTDRDRVWQCTDDTASAAVWQLVGGVYGASRNLGTNQSIPDSTFTRVDLDTTLHDPDSLFDANGEFVVPRTGIWSISAGIVWESNSTNIRIFTVRIDGVTNILRARQNAVQDSEQSSANTASALDSGDKIGIYVLQNSGGALNAQASVSTFLSAQFIGEL